MRARNIEGFDAAGLTKHVLSGISIVRVERDILLPRKECHVILRHEYVLIACHFTHRTMTFRDADLFGRLEFELNSSAMASAFMLGYAHDISL